MDEPQQTTTRDRAVPLTEMAGLGIDISSANRSSIDAGYAGYSPPPLRKVASAEDTGEQRTPNSSQPLMSPPSTGGLSGSTQFGQSPASAFNPYNYKPYSRASTTYTASTTRQSLPAESEASLLQKHNSASLYSAYGEFAAKHRCESIKGVKGSRKSWLSIFTIVLSIYSTVLSGLFVFFAITGPDYKTIRTGGPHALTPSNAALITTILAKTIELSFVTVIIALLGQQLSRKAFGHRRRSGVSLAELSMRTWVMQPGTLLFQWQTVRYAGASALGLLAVAAALLALLYTSASSALVQPQLKFGKWNERTLEGRVRASFANVNHISADCYTPVSSAVDPVEHARTCLSIEHAAMAYKNYYTYLGKWSDNAALVSRGSDPIERPDGTALFGNDTTVIAPWVDNKLNHTAAFNYLDTGIIINNVSIAFPHTGVATAAKDPMNKISQPEDLNGVGRYIVNASVPSPVLHSLCATVSEEHLAPLIFDKWNMTQEPLNHTTWPAQLQFSDSHPSPYLNGTPLDDIFEWGEKYGENAWPPLFMKLPQDYNTMVNGTGVGAQQYGRRSIYILGKAHSTDLEQGLPGDLDYFLCQLQVSQSPFCYTSYQEGGQGAVLETVCEESAPTGDSMRYIEDNEEAPSSHTFADKDWPNVASEMAHALALNDGMFDGKSANARLLTQLLLREPRLDPTKPSLAEALAVLAGCTLLQSTLDAPFIHYWNYTADSATNGVLHEAQGAVEKFRASIRAQQYASGGVEPYQQGFHIVLFGVFILNVVALAYFLTHKTWYVDFSEPHTLFSLAVNSPPSEALAGCCGTGPQGKDYGVAWTLEQDGGHVFVHSGARHEAEGDEGASPGLKRRKAWRSMSGSPVVKGFGKLRRWSRDV